MRVLSLYAVPLLLLAAAPVFAEPPSVDNGLITLGQAGSLAETGPEADVPIGGLWQEFKFGPAGSPAGACDDTCWPSAGGNSEYAPSPPWTFRAPFGGVRLTVTDAWAAGDIFEVFDFGVSLGTTSSVATGHSCWSDPAICVLDPLMSSAVFNLGPGSHSITIKSIASPHNIGAAYFRTDESVSFSKTASIPVALPSDPVTYTISVHSDAATDITELDISDTLPTYLTYLKDSLTATAGSFGYASRAITWTGSVSAGGSVKITFGTTISDTVPLGTRIINSAIISSSGEMITRLATLFVGRQIYLPVMMRAAS